MNDELVGKCRLTAEEFTKCGRDIPNETLVEQAAEPWLFGTKLIEKQLTKAIPIIRKAVAEEIKKGLEEDAICAHTGRIDMVRGFTDKQWDKFWEGY